MAVSRTQRRKFKAKSIEAKNARLIKASLCYDAKVRADIVANNLASPIPSRYVDGRGLYRSSCADLATQSHRAHVSSNIKRIELFGIDDNGRMR